MNLIWIVLAALLFALFIIPILVKQLSKEPEKQDIRSVYVERAHQEAAEARAQAEALEARNLKLLGANEQLANMILDRREDKQTIRDAVEAICGYCGHYKLSDRGACLACRWEEYRETEEQSVDG